MDKKNLKRSPSGVWLFRRRVPKALKEKAKYSLSDTICISLKTKSLTEARVRRDALNAEIALEAQEANSFKPVRDRFHQIYAYLKRKEIEDERHARTLGERESNFIYSHDPENNPDKGDKVYADAFYAVVDGHIPDKYRLKVSELYEEWREANTGKQNTKYLDTAKTAINSFVDYLEYDEFPEDITMGTAQGFLDYALDLGKSASTLHPRRC